MAGRPRWWVAGLSLFLALVVGLVVWLTHARLDVPRAAERPRARAGILGRGERPAARPARPPYAATTPAPAAALGCGTAPAARTLAGVVRNGRALHVRGFSLRYVDQAGGVAPDGAFTAYVHASWRFAGFDPRPERMEVRVRFAPRDGHLAHRRHRRGRPPLAAVALGPGPGTPLVPRLWSSSRATRPRPTG